MIQTFLQLYDQESLQAIIDELKLFEENTGLKANYSKTTVFQIGAISSRVCKLKTSENL